MLAESTNLPKSTKTSARMPDVQIPVIPLSEATQFEELPDVLSEVLASNQEYPAGVFMFAVVPAPRWSSVAIQTPPELNRLLAVFTDSKLASAARTAITLANRRMQHAWDMRHKSGKRRRNRGLNSRFGKCSHGWSQRPLRFTRSRSGTTKEPISSSSFDPRKRLIISQMNFAGSRKRLIQRIETHETLGPTP